MNNERENIISLDEITPALVKAIFDIFVLSAATEAEQMDAELYVDFDPNEATEKIIRLLTTEDKYNPASICVDNSYSDEGVMFFRYPLESEEIAIEYDPSDRYLWPHHEAAVENRRKLFNEKLKEYLAKRQTSQT